MSLILEISSDNEDVPHCLKKKNKRRKKLNVDNDYSPIDSSSSSDTSVHPDSDSDSDYTIAPKKIIKKKRVPLKKGLVSTNKPQPNIQKPHLTTTVSKMHSLLLNKLPITPTSRYITPAVRPHQNQIQVSIYGWLWLHNLTIQSVTMGTNHLHSF